MTGGPEGWAPAPLENAVRRFLDDVTPGVEALAAEVPALRADRLAGDVALDAFELTAAFVDADGLHTDNELWALIAVFGPLLESQLGRATPSDIRQAGLVTGKRHLLERPSALFDVLCKADQRKGTANAWTYYERAMALAHEVGTTDVHVSHLELAAIERYRSVLLGHLASHSIARPGSAGAPAATGGSPNGMRATGAGAGAPAGTAPADALPPARPVEELYRELDDLVGLDAVKDEVKLVANLIRVQAMRRERGLPVTEASRHLVFSGNPGTGKTTVARLLAQIYRSLGVVGKGHLVETDRAGLVAGFVGQTALKVQEVFARAMEGVLLVDEAYALARGRDGDFGQEAVDTMVKLIEDHRDDVVVILTGYPDEMHVLVTSNPGFASRFPKTIHFPDYTDDELVRIFRSMCDAGGYRPDGTTLEKVRARFEAAPRGKGFGNARLARNLFEAMVAAQASRVVHLADVTDAQLCAFTPADIEAVPPA